MHFSPSALFGFLTVAFFLQPAGAQELRCSTESVSGRHPGDGQDNVTVSAFAECELGYQVTGGSCSIDTAGPHAGAIVDIVSRPQGARGFLCSARLASGNPSVYAHVVCCKFE